MDAELARVRDAVRLVERAELELVRAIRAASAAGVPQRAIANAAGVSQGYVWRLLHPEYRDTGKR